MNLRKTLFAMMASGAIILANGAAHAETTQISIGTGGVTGAYYAVGAALCRMINKDTDTHGVKCSVESTAGSVFNLNAIRDGEMELGIAQSDIQFHAARGTSKHFEEIGPDKNLRALFSLHSEPVTLVTRTDTGIGSFKDLKGRVANVGNTGSGTRATNELVLNAFGLSFDDLTLAADLRSSEIGQALCDNKIDAFSWVAGHPSGFVAEAVSTCQAIIAPVTGKEIDALVEEFPYFAKTSIPGGIYPGVDEDVDTFGPVATFVSSDTVPNDVVYSVVKVIFDNLDSFKKLHPALANLNRESMLTNGLSIPLHEGAEKYYREQDWID